MADIAQVLGISKNAVSLALSGNAGVSDQTREAVHRTAQQLGYRRRGRGRTRLRSVALIFNESLLQPPATLFFGPLIQNLQKELGRRNFSLTVFGVSDADERAMRLPPWSKGAFEGIVVLSGFSSPFVRELQTRAPVVWMDHYDATVSCDKVVTENRLGAYVGTKHLIDAGLTRIGFLGDVNHSPSYLERWQGYRLALQSHDLSSPDCWQWTTADPDRLEPYWKGLADRPSGWFCVNDILAARLVHHVQACELAVPEDVAVVGFDDLQLAQLTVPSITTMHVAVEYYTARAVEVLTNRLEHPGQPPELIRITPFLVVRESSRQLDHGHTVSAETALSKADRVPLIGIKG